MNVTLKKRRPSKDAFYYALVYPGIGHFLLRRFASGFLFAALATGFVALFFNEFWVQIRLFVREASEAVRNSNAPLPQVHYGRMLFWLLGLTLVYAISLADVWLRIKPRPSPPPPLPHDP